VLQSGQNFGQKWIWPDSPKIAGCMPEIRHIRSFSPCAQLGVPDAATELFSVLSRPMCDGGDDEYARKEKYGTPQVS